jgi:lipid A ethanolaminephosphotransferase
LSHDKLFHSVLGLMAVKTTVYQRERDLFAACEGR